MRGARPVDPVEGHGCAAGQASEFAVLPRRRISVVIRLLWQLEFVDRVRNSVVPPSNEFAAQAVEMPPFFISPPASSAAKNAIFAVLRSG
jgi:hypothetical protein